MVAARRVNDSDPACRKLTVISDFARGRYLLCICAIPRGAASRSGWLCLRPQIHLNINLRVSVWHKIIQKIWINRAGRSYGARISTVLPKLQTGCSYGAGISTTSRKLQKDRAYDFETKKTVCKTSLGFFLPFCQRLLRDFAVVEMELFAAYDLIIFVAFAGNDDDVA